MVFVSALYVFSMDDYQYGHKRPPESLCIGRSPRGLWLSGGLTRAAYYPLASNAQSSGQGSLITDDVRNYATGTEQSPYPEWWWSRVDNWINIPEIY